MAKSPPRQTSIGRPSRGDRSSRAAARGLSRAARGAIRSSGFRAPANRREGSLLDRAFERLGCARDRNSYCLVPTSSPSERFLNEIKWRRGELNRTCREGGGEGGRRIGNLGDRRLQRHTAISPVTSPGDGILMEHGRSPQESTNQNPENVRPILLLLIRLFQVTPRSGLPAWRRFRTSAAPRIAA